MAYYDNSSDNSAIPFSRPQSGAGRPQSGAKSFLGKNNPYGNYNNNYDKGEQETEYETGEPYGKFYWERDFEHYPNIIPKEPKAEAAPQSVAQQISRQLFKPDEGEGEGYGGEGGGFSGHTGPNTDVTDQVDSFRDMPTPDFFSNKNTGFFANDNKGKTDKSGNPLNNLVNTINDPIGAIKGKVNNALDNPFEFAANTLISGTPLGGLNTLSGLVGGPTIGGLLGGVGKTIGGLLGVTDNAAPPSSIPNTPANVNQTSIDTESFTPPSSPPGGGGNEGGDGYGGEIDGPPDNDNVISNPSPSPAPTNPDIDDDSGQNQGDGYGGEDDGSTDNDNTESGGEPGGGGTEDAGDMD